MKTKSIFRLVTALALLCWLFPLTARRAEAAGSYYLYIGNMSVTDETLSGANWAFDPASYTLTLDNYTYKGPGQMVTQTTPDGNYITASAILYGGSNPLTITLKGNNSLTQTFDSSSESVILNSGIRCTKSSLTIQGSGSLTIQAGYSEEKSIGIDVYQNLIMASTGAVISTGGSTGSYGDSAGIDAQSCTVESGTLIAVGGDASSKYSYSYGIDLGPGSLTVNGGTVTAAGGNAYGTSVGVHAGSAYVNGGTLNVAGGDVTDTGSGKSVYDSVGIDVTYALRADNGTVTACGGTGNGSCGIRARKNINVSGSADVTAVGGSARGDSCGVIAGGSKDSDGITVNGGTLTATGGTSSIGICSGIRCLDKLIVRDGTVEAGGRDYGVFAAERVAVYSGRLTAAGGESGGSPSYGIFCQNGEIHVGFGSVKATGGKTTGSSSTGVCAANDNVTVNGGTLTATGGTADLGSNGVYTIKGSVKVIGGSLIATGGKAGLDSCGINSKGSVTVGGGTLEATGVNYGVRAGSGVEVSNGEVNAWGGYSPDGTTCGIYAAGANARVSVSGGTVYATGGKTDSGSTFGIGTEDADVAVSGGSVYATGGIAGDGGKSCGVRSAGEVLVEDGLLNASGFNCGAYAGTGVMVSGGELTAVADNSSGHAIHAEDGGVSVSGGKVTASAATGIFTLSEANGDVVISGDGTEVIAKNGEYGFYSARDILISGGSVTAEGRYYGMAADGDLRVSGGDVGAKATAPYAYGVYTGGAVALDYPALRFTALGDSTFAAYAEGGIRVGEGMVITDPESGAVDSESGRRWIVLSPTDSTRAELVTIEQGLYTLRVEEPENGSVAVSPVAEYYHYTDPITVTVSPDTGYEPVYLTCNGMEITGGSFMMPGADATVRAEFRKTDYTVSVSAEHGTVQAPTTANYGDTVSLTVKADTGYTLDRLAVTDADGKPVAVSGGKFTMPASNVKISAVFKAISYTVTVSDSPNGAAAPDRTSAKYGETVTLTVSPATGYELQKLTVTDADNNAVAVSGGKFTMPASDVKISAVFRAILPAVSGHFDGSGKLMATVTAPADSVLIAAAYEPGGRQAGVKLIRINAVCVGKEISAGLSKEAGCRYKLMLADGAAFAPLCQAWGD